MNNSVATKVKEGHEYCLVIHCVAHRLKLAILAAIKGHNGLIYKHYKHSSKALRKREIRNIAEAMEFKLLKPNQEPSGLPHGESDQKISNLI